MGRIVEPKRQCRFERRAAHLWLQCDDFPMRGDDFRCQRLNDPSGQSLCPILLSGSVYELCDKKVEYDLFRLFR